MNKAENIWSIFGKPPDEPAEYPCKMQIRDLYGVQRHVFKNKRQFDYAVFWYWSAMPCGSSVAERGDADLL